MTGSYERKAELPAWSHEHAVGLLRMHPAGFREIYRARVVNNLYLDTANLDAYWDNLGGIGRRSKIRVRFYGDAVPGPLRPQLELKHKRDYLRLKEVTALSEVQGGGEIVEPLLAAATDAQLPGRARSVLLNTRPVLLNHYRRRYFLSADGRLRATVDWDLGFRQVYPDGRCGPLFTEHHAVFELKYELGDDDLARAAMQRLPFRLTRHSKYARGVELLFDV